MRRSEAPAAFALLAAAAWLCAGGPLVARLGFYRDDWSMLELLKSSHSWLGLLRAVADQPQLSMRPLDVPETALALRLFGDAPLGWQLYSMLTNALTGLCVWALARAFRAPRTLAALGAMLFLAYPSKDTALFWAGYLNGPLALLTFLAGFLAHLRYVETGRRPWLASAVVLFAVSLASYDSCLFLAPILFLAPGPRTEASAARAKTAFSGLALAVLASAAWRVVAMRSLQAPSHLRLSPLHAAAVYAAAVNANLGPDLVLAALRSVARAFAAAPATALVALALPSALLLPSGEEPADASDSRRLVLLGLAIFILGYLPMAISPYMPAPMAEEDRLNLVPAAGLVLALVGLASRLETRKARLLLAPLAAVLMAASVGFSASWGAAYARALAVRSLVARHLSEWPREDALVLVQPSLHVDGRGPVFDHEYILAPAIRLWTGDSERRAFILRPGAEFTSRGLALDGRAVASYGAFDVLDSASGEFLVHPDETRCRALAIPSYEHNPVASWVKLRLANGILKK